MQSEKLLTISIAAYNVESSLERTLSSVECGEELLSLLDIIIVDDGSSDGTPQIAERFVSKHPDSVRLIRKANGGYGSTVNAAVKASRGLYFKLLDGDDTFDTAGLEALLKYLAGASDEEAPDIVIAPFVYELTDPAGDGRESRTVLSDRHQQLQSTPVRLEDACLDDGLMMFEICVKTDVLRKSGVQLTENCYYTDNEYVMEANLYAETAVRFPEPVYVYRLGVAGQSMSIEGRRKHHEDKIKAAYGVFSIYDRYAERDAAYGSRKLITDKLISTMTREVYVSTMIQQDRGRSRAMLREYDSELKEKHPYAYKISGDSRLVSAVRRSGPAAYEILCRKMLREESRRTLSGETGLHMHDRVLKAAEYIAAVCLIIQCRTVYMHLENVGMIVNRTVWAVMMAALAVCILKSSRSGPAKTGQNTKVRDAAKVCLAIIAYAGIFLLVNPVNYLRVIRCASALAMMIILIKMPDGKRKSRDILGCYKNLMLAVAAVSMCGWILGSVLQILPCTGWPYIDWSSIGQHVRIPTFLNIYFETQWTDWTLIHARNTGIFVEAPMAGFSYCTALIIECFISGCHDKRRHTCSIVLLAASVLSTFSLICYGFLILLVLCEVLRRYSSGGISRKAMAVIASLTAVAVIFLAVMISRKLQRVSAFVRVNDFIVGFNAWMAHPWFGGGFESLEYLQSFMPDWRFFDIGFSNSPMEILAQGGIYLAVPYVYSFISALIKACKRKDVQLASVTIMFGYLFVLIVVPYQYITFLMLTILAFDGLTDKRDEKHS